MLHWRSEEFGQKGFVVAQVLHVARVQSSVMAECGVVSPPRIERDLLNFCQAIRMGSKVCGNCSRATRVAQVFATTSSQTLQKMQGQAQSRPKKSKKAPLSVPPASLGQLPLKRLKSSQIPKGVKPGLQVKPPKKSKKDSETPPPPPVSLVRRNLVGISRDHSGSMERMKIPAMNDYNEILGSLKAASSHYGIETTLFTIMAGIGHANNGVMKELMGVDIQTAPALCSYRAEGSTPLFDSVGELIQMMLNHPAAQDPSTTFTVMVITDGEENSSRVWKHRLGAEINRLTATDRWTFTFRVPLRGGPALAAKLGVPMGNIQEWETTSAESLRRTTVQTSSAVQDHYKSLQSGNTRSVNFYANTSHLNVRQLNKELADISKEVDVWMNEDPRKVDIRTMCNSYLKHGESYQTVRAFYELIKPELIQEYKKIVIRDNQTGKCYAGTLDEVRHLIGIPAGRFKVHPEKGSNRRFDVFIQSTSVNRAMLPQQRLLYWRSAR